jgi:hypothetical protein
MKPDGADAAWAAARAAEPGAMSRDELAVLLADVRRVRSCLAAIEVRASRRARELEAVGQAEPAESLIATAGGHDGRDASTVTERDELCEEMPDVEAALDGGGLSGAHVDAIASARRRLPEELHDEFAALVDELIARAARVSIETFRRECRRLAGHLIARSRPADAAAEFEAQVKASKLSRWVDRQTGMHHTNLVLDPVRDAKLYAAMQAELARLRHADTSPDRDWQQLQVDAFVNTIAGIRTPHATDDQGDGSDARPVDRVPEITVLVSYDWLTGLADHGICETGDGDTLPISTVRRRCCDAEIIPAVLGGGGEVLDQGRSRRTANRAQRRALRAMHRGCAHPDCHVGFSACRIHHIRWWWRDSGRSDIDNMLPLCERHHHLVHEGGWTLTMTPDRTATWTRPDGRLHHRGTTIDRTSASGPASTDAMHTAERADRVVPATPDSRNEDQNRTDRTDRADRSAASDESDRPATVDRRTDEPERALR